MNLVTKFTGSSDGAGCASSFRLRKSQRMTTSPVESWVLLFFAVPLRCSLVFLPELFTYMQYVAPLYRTSRRIFFNYWVRNIEGQPLEREKCKLFEAGCVTSKTVTECRIATCPG